MKKSLTWLARLAAAGVRAEPIGEVDTVFKSDEAPRDLLAPSH